MKTTVFLGVALVFLASNMQAEAQFSEMAKALKERLEKLKDFAKKHMSERSPGVEDFSKHVASTLMKHFEDVKDPKAFEGFVNHLVHAHAHLVLRHNVEMSKLFITYVHVVIKRHNVPIPIAFKWVNLADDLNKFVIDEFNCYKKRYVTFLKKHSLTMDPKTAQNVFEDILKTVVEGKDATKVISSVIKKYTKMTSEIKAIQQDFEKQVELAAAKSKENLRKLLQKHKLSVPDAGLIELLNDMIKMKLTKTMKHHSSVEKSLKEHFNQAMDLMHKAFGEMEPDSTHNMMEKMKAMVPDIFRNRLNEIQAMMKKNGEVVSTTGLMTQIHSQTKPKYSEDDEEERRRHHHSRRHYQMVLVYIFVPIGAVLLIALVSVVIYIYCRPKPKASRSSVYIEKPPLEKVNPYENMEPKKPVSLA